MNREAFKLARDTLRKAVKEYGWYRKADSNYGPTYLARLGKFEGEHWSIVHWYDAMMNGAGDEPFTEGEETVADVFPVEDIERAAFMLKESDQFAVLWHSSQGFETLEYIDCDRYDRLREQYSEPSDNVVTYTAPSAWASYLINGDASGLEDGEQATVDAWLASIGLGDPVSCDDAGFRHVHDAFAFMPLAADCQTYSFLKE